MKRMFSVLIVLAFVTTCAQAQSKAIGGEGIVGEKSSGDAAIVKNNAQIEIAFAEYNRRREEFEKSLIFLQARIDEGIKLLEAKKRFRSPKQGIKLRNDWKEALKLQAEAEKKIKVIKNGVVAPDMVQ